MEKAEYSTGSILIYTRTPIEDKYSPDLANSIHLAYSRNGVDYQAWNQNYGIVFATATINEQNAIVAKGLRNPYIFHLADGGYGIIAIRTNTDGSTDVESKGKVLLWTSVDLLRFQEVGLAVLQQDADVQEVMCAYDAGSQEYVISWKDTDDHYYRNSLPALDKLESISVAVRDKPFAYTKAQNGPEGAILGNVLQIEAAIGEQLLTKWVPLTNIALEVPISVTAASSADVDVVTATAVYTDGSTAAKQVLWDKDAIDFSTPGAYDITGTVTQEVYSFPLAVGYADPDVVQWKGKYYFIATNDNADQVGLFVRESDTILGLFQEGIEERVILDRDESRGLIQTFWAPEFHIINGSLYILFAVSGSVWGPQSQMMKLKDDGNVMDPTSWEDPSRVKRMDGSELASDGITLDMTYFDAGDGSYLMWSYRTWNPVDSGSMLYIASIDSAEPWRLTSDPVLLSRPLYGWENIEGTINNEGPYAIVTNDHIHMVYSGGAAGGYSYALGLLTAKIDSNLLDPASWTKSNTPALSYYSVPNEYGPGHNACFTDQYGNLMTCYHAQAVKESSPRCTGIRRVHFNIDGVPVFNLSAERDLNEALIHVSMRVIVVEG